MSRPNHPSNTGLLQGWKEIAAYVSRDVRTVKRWEKQRELPVRRFPGEGRASVYALINELDDWITLRRAEPRGESLDAVPPVGHVTDAVVVSAPERGEGESPAKTSLASEDPDPSSNSAMRPLLHGRRRGDRPVAMRRLVLATTAGLALTLAMCAGLLANVRQTSAVRAAFGPRTAASSAAAGDVPYASTVAGVDELYARGIFFFEQRTPGTLELARQAFVDALAKDPKYAPAWAALANTYNLLREYATMPSDLAFAEAETAARHAVALDPRLAQAHASLGFIDFFWKWDAATAEREFRTAIALDPAAHLPHHWFGSMLTHQGRYAEALRELDQARHLKPDSLAILSVRAFAVGLSGRRAEAADLLQEVLSHDRTSPSAHRILAILSLVEPRDIPRYLDQRAQMSALSRDKVDAQVLDVARRAYGVAGEEAMWRALLAAEERAHPGLAGRNYQMAEAEAALGDGDAAFADLDLMVRRRDPCITGLNASPVMASLRSDPRFRRLIPPGLLMPVH